VNTFRKGREEEEEENKSKVNKIRKKQKKELDLVSDRTRNSHFRPKPNIRQQKSAEYSVSAQYSALLLTFGRKSMI
jgi:predicted subunit of tRNA(5-methylaminomethyl-2-thiouridylate) methyltransferase